MGQKVLKAMLPYFTEQFGNPHSRTHYYGWESEEAVEKAREVDILIQSFFLLLMTIFS
jgi:cysteine desulfurase